MCKAIVLHHSEYCLGIQAWIPYHRKDIIIICFKNTKEINDVLYSG